MSDQEKQKKSKVVPIILFLLFIITIAAVYAETQMGTITSLLDNSKKRLIPEGIRIEYGTGANPAFAKGSKGILCATRDGATYYSFKGEILWSQTFTMNSPYIAGDGGNWVIFEPNGRKAYVADEKGILYTVSTEYPILSANLNKIACLSLILDVDGTYRIQLFNSLGEMALERKSEMDGVFPVCTDLSDDGLMFSVAYIDTTKSFLVSRVLFFYTDAGAKKYAEDTQSPFAAVEREDTIISFVSFSEEGNLTAVSDTEVFVLSPSGSEIFSNKLQNEIRNCSIGTELFGLVYGEPFANATEVIEPGYATWYTYNGISATGYSAFSFSDEDVERINIYDELIVLKSSDTFYLSDKNGNTLWTYGAAKDIISVIPIDKKRALIARETAAEIYSYKTHEAKQEGEE